MATSAIWNLLTVALVTLTMGCTSAQKKESPREIWLIDGKECALYRVKNDETEQVIPLSSRDIGRFRCVDEREFR